MFNDEFKARYTTVPFAIYKAYYTDGAREVITHQHREIELICITEGSAVFYINSQSYSMKKGDILVIPPYALHRARTSATELTSYYCICFDLSLICDEWLKNGLETQSVSVKHMIVSSSDCSECSQIYIEKAFLACEKKEVGWELTAIGNMSLMFGVWKSNGFFSSNENASKDANFGKNVMKYIIANYFNKISSRDAANEIYMDCSSFCRLFKKTFGCCFTNYLLAYRLEKAKVYLLNTCLSVTEIAFKVGFNDCSYFCKAFKESMGISPLSYRKTRGG